MERRARRAEAKGAKTDLFELMRKHKRDRLTSGVWASALVRGDALATRLIDRAIEALERASDRRSTCSTSRRS